MVKIIYKCNICGEKQEVRLESILSERPESIPCLDFKCEGNATYDWSQLKSSSTHIKSHMKAGNTSRMNYSKMSRGQKKYK